TSAQCTPSRSSWMTGKYPHQVGVNMIGHKLDPAEVNLSKIFNQNGYETVHFGKWHLGGVPSDYGFQITNYSTEGSDFWGVNNHSSYFSYKDAQTTAKALNYLENHKNNKSFFMHVSWYLP